jgi:hypothetical protein
MMEDEMILFCNIKECSNCRAVANLLSSKGIEFIISNPKTYDIVLPQLYLDNGRILFGVNEIKKFVRDEYELVVNQNE